MEAAEYKAVTASHKHEQTQTHKMYRSCETTINTLRCVCFSLCGHVSAWFNNLDSSADYF